MRHRVLVIVAAIAGALVLAAPPAVAAGPIINGGGSAFVGIEVDAWRSAVARPPYSVMVNYQSLGSSSGRMGFIDGSLDFGISDIGFQQGKGPSDPKSEQARARMLRPSFTYIPISANGIAFMYHLGAPPHRITDLKLSPRTLCGIFTGFVTKWNDPAVVTDTQHPMPDKDIFPVVRADSSGQSLVLAEYCIEHAPDVWDLFIDAQNQAAGAVVYPKGQALSDWPKSFGKARSANFSDAVADAVAETDGAIAYVETGFAEQRKFPVASVKNESGRFTQPTPENVTNALAFAKVREDKTHQLDFRGPGEKVYYPSTYSYLIAETDGFDPAKGRSLAIFINYSCTRGQLEATRLGYAPLPANLINACLDEAQRIPGAPPRPASTTGDDLENMMAAPAAPARSATQEGTVLGPAAGGGVNAAAVPPAAAPAPDPAVAPAVDPSVAPVGAPAVDLGIGPVGATGAEHAVVGSLGVVLALGGAVLRRRSLRRTRAPGPLSVGGDAPPAVE